MHQILYKIKFRKTIIAILLSFMVTNFWQNFADRWNVPLIVSHSWVVLIICYFHPLEVYQYVWKVTWRNQVLTLLRIASTTQGKGQDNFQNLQLAQHVQTRSFVCTFSQWCPEDSGTKKRPSWYSRKHWSLSNLLWHSL